MGALEHPDALAAAGIVLLVVAFAARELAAGALRAAGQDLWAWAKRWAGRRGARADGDAPADGRR